MGFLNDPVITRLDRVIHAFILQRARYKRILEELAKLVITLLSRVHLMDYRVKRGNDKNEE